MVNNEQATFLSSMLLSQIENEQKTTRRVLAAIPEGKGDYKPDPKSKTATELAWHIASVDVWFLNSIADGAFPMEEVPMPAFKTPEDLCKWYDENFAKGLARARALKVDALTKVLNFFNAFNMPAVMYLMFLNNHMIHHRGQLSAYLRAMGGKVPSIYGGSADEPFEMPATA
jgi:uncharacterized damage-inducible protein DinB